MRPTLLLIFTLFLTACSNDSSSDNPITSNTTKQEVDEKQLPPKQLPSTPIKAAPIAPVKESAPNGYTLFAHKCASCHGKNAEKVALNKSQIIAGWESQKTMDVLKGYQDGSYGNSLKAIMRGQVTTLSEKQLKAVSKYISTL